MNPPSLRYTGTAIFLHWLLAIMIIFAFSLGITMTDIPGITPTKLKMFNWHKWLGVTIFSLAVIRLLWRITHKAPPLPITIPFWQRVIAEMTHTLLYILIFAIPLTGYFYSLASGFPVVYLGIIPLPVFIGADPELKSIFKQAHFLLNMGLAVIVIGHIGAALKHHFIDRDDILLRMLPKFSKQNPKI